MGGKVYIWGEFERHSHGMGGSAYRNDFEVYDAETDTYAPMLHTGLPDLDWVKAVHAGAASFFLAATGALYWCGQQQNSGTYVSTPTLLDTGVDDVWVGASLATTFGAIYRKGNTYYALGAEYDGTLGYAPGNNYLDTPAVSSLGAAVGVDPVAGLSIIHGYNTLAVTEGGLAYLCTLDLGDATFAAFHNEVAWAPLPPAGEGFGSPIMMLTAADGVLHVNHAGANQWPGYAGPPDFRDVGTPWPTLPNVADGHRKLGTANTTNLYISSAGELYGNRGTYAAYLIDDVIDWKAVEQNEHAGPDSLYALGLDTGGTELVMWRCTPSATTISSSEYLRFAAGPLRSFSAAGSAGGALFVIEDGAPAPRPPEFWQTLIGTTETP